MGIYEGQHILERVLVGGVDGGDDQVSSGVFLRGCLEVGHLRPARRAPARPEIEDQRFAGGGIGTEAASRGGLQLKLRGEIPHLRDAQQLTRLRCGRAAGGPDPEQSQDENDDRQAEIA